VAPVCLKKHDLKLVKKKVPLPQKKERIGQMKRIELSISVDYVPGWDAYQGIREYIQNAIDAQQELGATMTVDWHNDTLRIENEGVVLDRDMLLLGHSTKRDNRELRGFYGEGAKIGALALLRAGHPIKIRNGTEVWEPVIERSDRFNADVLVFKIHEGRKAENRVRVEIQNITKEAWHKMFWCFLFLNKDYLESDQQVKTYDGRLLMAPEYAGKIFVKGIFVQNNPDYRYGYDLFHTELDRDRKMVESNDLKYRVRKIWEEAISSRPDLTVPFFKMFDEQVADVSGIDKYNAGYVGDDLVKTMAEQFETRYGVGAIPVLNMEQSREIEHFGKRGIVVSAGLEALLSRKLGGFEKVRESLRSSTVKRYGWSDLDSSERTVLEQACQMFGKTGYKLGLPNIVDFARDDLEGLYISENGESSIEISRKHLKDRNKVLQIMVHEAAHHISKASDGTKDHVATIEDFWMKIVSSVWA